MPTVTTIKPFGVSPNATNTATGGTGVTGGAATSGPLTSAIAQHRFPTTAAPTTTTTAKTPTKGKGKAATIKTPTTGKNVPVTTRGAVLRLIAAMGAGGPEHEMEGSGTGEAIPGLRSPTPTTPGGSTVGGKTNVGTPMVASVGHGPKIQLTGTILAVINTIGKHVFKSKTFTIDTFSQTMTAKQWGQIVTAASTRAKEHELSGALTAAQTKATQTTTTQGVTGQALYTLWLATYDSNKTGSTPNTKKLTTKQIWDQRFVAMGIPDTDTPTPAQAQQAYKQILTQAQQGNTSATEMIQTQIKTHTPTLIQAQQTTGTATSASDYFYQQFETIAHSYLVPMNSATLNQYAATAAKSAGDTFYDRENAEENFKQTMQKQAASLYSTFATQINKGVTTRTLLNPYAEVAAKTLGYGTSTATTTAISDLGITWMSPKWNVALSGGKSVTGKLSAPMSLTAFRQHLITTPQYGWANTATGQQMKLNVGQQLAQTFGLRKS